MADRGEHAAPTVASLIAAYRNPHDSYDTTRAANPILFDGTINSWIVTGHAATRAVLSHSEFSSALAAEPAGRAPGKLPFLQAAIQKQILFSDDERHRRVQKVVLEESARAMHEDAAEIRRLAARLVETAAARGHFDLVTDFALPYTMQTICRMVGIPTADNAMIADLAQWSSTFANVTSGYLQVHIREIAFLGDRFRSLVVQPIEQLRGVIRAFRAEQVFDDEDDLIANCMMVFAAGRITTQKVIGDGVPLLLPHWPEWRAAVAADATVVRHLTEELLRLVTPTRYVARRVVNDVDLSPFGAVGSTARTGERIFAFLEAANRDAHAFPRPHELLANRQQNAHVAFGHGPHRCPGASLARLEIQIALDALLRTMQYLRPDPASTPTWEANPNLGGFKSYPCLCQ